ncbi:MAG: spore cortex biosynthesis protein YabQ [Acutalibacteraceae bacterium]|jgi:spore cortex biosynthesis protein YabQ
MWEISNSLQLLGLARSAVYGVVLCLAYDLLRALRRVKEQSAAAIFFQDVIFSVLAGITTFLFLLGITNGEFRGFVIIGMTAGFAVSRLTISPLLMSSWIFIISKFYIAIKFISDTIYRSFDFCEKKLSAHCKMNLQ